MHRAPKLQVQASEGMDVQGFYQGYVSDEPSQWLRIRLFLL